MPMSPIEKMVLDAVKPLVVQELDGPVAAWLAANLKSASPQIQAAEQDLAPFLIKCIADVLGTL